MAARRGLCLLGRYAASRSLRQRITTHKSLLTVTTQRQLHTSHPRLANQTDAFAVINVQDKKDFEERVLKSEIPVVVDFHATWCHPCKLLAPRLEKILSSNSKPVSLVKVDVDKFEDLAMKYKVQGVPAVFAVKDGKVTDKFVGLQDEDIIEQFVERLVK